jgi:transposase InsO family protein
MKDSYRQISLSRFCRLLGVTRQAYYQHFWQVEFKTTEETLIVAEVLRIRKNHKHMGGRKLFEILQPFLLEHGIKMGRDAFFDLLQASNLLVRRKKRKIYTTQSFHWYRKYPNKIKGLTPNGPNQIWVSDITYWKINCGYVYISLITDAYSRKIVGYNLADTLDAIETTQALKNALGDLQKKPIGLIHHSDRGLQYCSSGYVKLLKDHQIEISMTENGDPYENALAERVNGILKEEYLYDYSVDSLDQARLVLDFVIKIYNTERPHLSCSYKTPEFVHEGQ